MRIDDCAAQHMHMVRIIILSWCFNRQHLSAALHVYMHVVLEVVRSSVGVEYWQLEILQRVEAEESSTQECYT